MSCHISCRSEPHLDRAAEVSEASEAKEEKAKPRKRKPTFKQLAEAEAAARPVYEESQRPATPSNGPSIKILTWNVASLNSTLKKDALAISRLVEKEGANVVCLQVASQETLAIPQEMQCRCRCGVGGVMPYALFLFTTMSARCYS